MRLTIGRIAALTVLWVALWGEVAVGTVLAGIGLSTALVLALPLPRPAGPAGTIRPLHALRFLGYFLWKLAEASAIVAWEVVTPRNRINEAIVAVPIVGVSELLATVVANAITLTPGTLTLEYRSDTAVLYVHVLHFSSIDEVRRDVRRLEWLAVRAFGNAVARAVVEDAHRADQDARRTRDAGGRR